MPKIFISYRRADSAMLATHLAVMLKSSDIDAFVDTRSIDGGGPFPNRLRRAIEECDVFVCLLGESTLVSEWVRKEIEHAHKLNKVLIPVFQERYIAPNPIPDDHVYELLQSDGVHILDVRNLYIEAAIDSLAEMIHKTPPQLALSVALPPINDVPDNFPPEFSIVETKKRNEHHVAKRDGKWTVSSSPVSSSVDRPLMDEDEMAKRLKQLSVNILKILLPPFEWCFVPSGNVILATDPPKTYTISDFAIAKYTITNAQYQVFAESRDGYMYEDNWHWYSFSSSAKEYRSKHPKPNPIAFEGDDLPRTNLSWYDCVAFSRWLAHKTSLAITLPTEQQWQRAAVGDTGWTFPWGTEFDSARCNTEEAGINKPVSVNSYMNGVSPFGAFNMSGNVWEWCLTNYASLEEADITSNTNRRVLRGGAFSYDSYLAAASSRFRSDSDFNRRNYGLRLVLSAAE